MVVIGLNFEYGLFIIHIFAKLALTFALSIQLIHLLQDGLLKYYNNQLLFFFTTSNEMGQ
jgi:capsular polysaccharide biosynthesis protein